MNNHPSALDTAIAIAHSWGADDTAMQWNSAAPATTPKPPGHSTARKARRRQQRKSRQDNRR